MDVNSDFRKVFAEEKEDYDFANIARQGRKREIKRENENNLFFFALIKRFFEKTHLVIL